MEPLVGITAGGSATAETALQMVVVQQVLSGDGGYFVGYGGSKKKKKKKKKAKVGTVKDGTMKAMFTTLKTTRRLLCNGKTYAKQTNWLLVRIWNLLKKKKKKKKTAKVGTPEDQRR